VYRVTPISGIRLIGAVVDEAVAVVLKRATHSPFARARISRNGPSALFYESLLKLTGTGDVKSRRCKMRADDIERRTMPRKGRPRPSPNTAPQLPIVKTALSERRLIAGTSFS